MTLPLNKPAMIEASVLSQTITETRPRRTLNLLMALTAIAQTGAKL